MQRALVISAHVLCHYWHGFSTPLAVVGVLLTLSWLRASLTPPINAKDFPKDILKRCRLKKADGSDRYCRICGVYKPDRAHHDHHSKTCVLVMDHHSPLLANVVGHHNLKYFVLMNFYAVLHVAVACCGMLASPYSGVMDAVCGKLFPVLLLAYHLFICRMSMRGLPFGYTTVEWYEKKQHPAHRQLWGQRSPYSRGSVVGNLVEVLGANPLTMLLPLGPGSTGDPFAPRLSPEGELLVRGSPGSAASGRDDLGSISKKDD